jgi:hypothetical protein
MVRGDDDTHSSRPQNALDTEFSAEHVSLLDGRRHEGTQHTQVSNAADTHPSPKPRGKTEPGKRCGSRRSANAAGRGAQPSIKVGYRAKPEARAAIRPAAPHVIAGGSCADVGTA